MKKIVMIVALGWMLVSSVFAVDFIDALLYPVFTGDLNKVEYKVVKQSEGMQLLEIDGKTYIFYDNK